MNFLRIFRAIKIRVALEQTDLAQGFREKMNIFHLRKIFQRLFCGGSEVKGWFGREINTWVKAKDAQVFKSI